MRLPRATGKPAESRLTAKGLLVNVRVLAAVVLAGSFMLWGRPCPGQQAEIEGIERLLREFRQCWVQKDLNSITTLVSDEYADSGGATKAGVRQGLELFLAVGFGLSVDRAEIDVGVTPAVIRGVEMLELSGTPGWALTFGVREEKGVWRVVSLEMENILPPAAPEQAMTLEEAFRLLTVYDFGKDNRCTGVIAEAVRQAPGDEPLRQMLQAHLLDVLSADTPRGAKDFACRQLALIADESCVAPLARFVTEEPLSTVALMALEGMPYASVDAALLDALRHCAGQMRLSIIDALGGRASAAAVPALSLLIGEGDAQTAAACIIALGKIGTPEALAAVAAVAESPGAAPSEVVDACWQVQLEQADRLGAANGRAEALALYDRLLAGAPDPVRAGAFAGKAALLGEEALPWLITALRGEDAPLAAAAAQNARRLSGPEATAALVEVLQGVSTELQVAIIGALGDRGDQAAGDAILPFLQHPEGNVRRAAAEALSKIGGPSCIAALATLAASAPSNEETDMARDALVLLNGAGVAEALRAHLFDQPAEIVRELIQAIENRGDSHATADLLRFAQLEDKEREARAAALRAVGRLAPPAELETLLALIEGPFTVDLRIDLEQSVLALISRAADPDAARTALMQAVSGASQVEARGSLYRVMGQVGEEAFLEPLRAGIQDSDPLVRDAAIRALVEWPRASALDTLSGIMESAEDKVHRVLAARGVVRLLGTAEDIPDDAKIAYCRSALALAETDDQRRMLLGALAQMRLPQALELAAPYTELPGLRVDASFAAHRNVLGGARARASANTDMAGFAIDGDRATCWTSARPQEAGMHFVVDLGAQYEITTLVLDAAASPNEYPRAFQIGVSLGEEDPQTVASGEAVNDVVRLTFPPSKARVLWIILSAPDTAPWSINEIGFLDTESGKLGIRWVAP